MNRFKALAELEVPQNICKKTVIQEAKTIRFEFSLRSSFMVKGISLTISLIMFIGAFIPFLGEYMVGMWKVSLIMLAFALPPFIVFMPMQKTHRYCLLDFKNMKIRTGITNFWKERNILSEDINNIESN